MKTDRAKLLDFITMRERLSEKELAKILIQLIKVITYSIGKKVHHSRLNINDIYINDKLQIKVNGFEKSLM